MGRACGICGLRMGPAATSPDHCQKPARDVIVVLGEKYWRDRVMCALRCIINVTVVANADYWLSFCRSDRRSEAFDKVQIGYLRES
jgi:hypothetical protein